MPSEPGGAVALAPWAGQDNLPVLCTQLLGAAGLEQSDAGKWESQAGLKEPAGREVLLIWRVPWAGQSEMWWVRALEEWYLCGAGGCGASFLNALGLLHQGGCWLEDGEGKTAS